MERNRIRNTLFFLALLLLTAACDEGKIFPDETINTGRTATVTLSFQGLGAWPKKNYLSFVALNANGEPTLTKRFSRPSGEEKKTSITLNGLEAGTRALAIVVISNGLKVVYSYYAFPIDDSMTEITLPVNNVNLASFSRIQQQVFNESCVACHGGSTHPAGGLTLTEGKSHAALVGTHVIPGDPENSNLIDVLETSDRHKDMFNSSGKQEVLALIEAWIKDGASKE